MKELFTKKNLLIVGGIVAVGGAIAAIVLTRGKAAEAVAEVAEGAAETAGNVAETVVETVA